MSGRPWIKIEAPEGMSPSGVQQRCCVITRSGPRKPKRPTNDSRACRLGDKCTEERSLGFATQTKPRLMEG